MLAIVGEHVVALFDRRHDAESNRTDGKVDNPEDNLQPTQNPYMLAHFISLFA